MHRVVIVGCGFGGLFAAKALRRAPVEVVVVDRTNHHLFQPLLYQVATGVLSEGDIAPPIRDVLKHQRNASVVLGEVVDIDVDHGQLILDTLGRQSTLRYDSLIVATGASQSYFGHDEYARNAPGMKTIDDALELRGRIFGAFEIAELEPDATAQAPWLTFAVVGAGPTGVELSGQIAELSRRSLHDNFRNFDPEAVRIVLLDAVDNVLPTFPESVRRRAKRDLEKLGVEVRLGSRVVGLDATGVDLDGGARIEARTKIWAAGVQASPLGRILSDRTGAVVDRSGRVEVSPDCSLPGHPEVFVVGDLMALDALPGLAEVAMQSGHHAARTIVRRLRGRDAKPFRYVDLGTLATISRFRAVAVIGRLKLSGFPAWVVWLVVHLAFLTGFKNRIAAVANWTVAFLGHGRRQRTITKQEVFARGTRPRNPECESHRRARALREGGPGMMTNNHVDDGARQQQRAQTKLGLAAMLVPVFFVIMFATCIIGTYHEPHPNGIKVGIVGPDALTAPLRARLEQSVGSAFDIRTVATVADAEHDVRARDLNAAFVPTANPNQPGVVIVASAGGRIVAVAAETLARAVTTAQGAQLTVRDVRPLTSGDEIGLGVFMLMIVCTICGYLAPTILSTVAPELAAARFYTIIAATAVVVPTIAYLIGGLGFGTYTGGAGTLLAFIGVGALYTFVIGLGTRMFQLLLGPQGGLFMSLAIFVFVNIASLGATYTVVMLQPFWRFFNHIWLGAGAVNAERSLLYFDGSGVGMDVLRILIWMAIIVAVLFLQAARNRAPSQRRTARRRSDGGDDPIVGVQSAVLNSK